ncbi:MAG: hypothetical protein GXZ07_07800 [Firmicutes bacterium]|nr:hypothetical protein [Bacillota bacterium]
MRKTFCLIVLLLLFGSAAGGCIGQNADFTLRIVPPQNPHLPLQGTWEIVSVLKEGTPNNRELAEQWVGKTLHFGDKNILLGGYFLPEFRCQVKRVQAEAYILYQQQVFPDGFRFQNAEIEVITLSDDHLFLCEFVREGGGELLLILFNNSYLVRKISDDVDETVFTSVSAAGFDIGSLAEPGSKFTGVLLGLRSPNPDQNNRQNDHYRTLWLALEDRKLAPVLETEGIIFPRRRGFYRLEVAAKSWGEKGEDFLIAVDMSEEEWKDDLELSPDPLLREGKEGYIHRRIRYIGNDYLSVEETVKQIPISRGGAREESRLYTVAVDGLPGLRAIKISDLAGDGALRAMEQGKINLLRQLGLEQTGPVDEENFCLARKMGYWIFNGRLSYPKDGVFVTADYNVDVIAPSHVVFYNKLNIPWPRVKNYIPAALDIFTSPNRDLALVVTNNEILVYGMFQDNLSGRPLERISLKEGEEVIMAEWALGQYYVENWAMTFQNLH